MSSRPPVVLEEEHYLQWRREMELFRADLANQRRNLAQIAVRRHQGGYPAPERVRFRNDNSGTVPAHGVMRVTDTTTIAGKVVVTTDQSNTTFQRRLLVNGARPIGTGKPGWGTWLWQAEKVLYASGTPALNEEWGPSNGSWALSQNRPGFLIAGGLDTTALTVHAQQILAQSVLGKADTAIANAASGTVRVYAGTPGSEADTSQTISSCFNKGPDIADEAWVTVSWLHGKPYVWLANCP